MTISYKKRNLQFAFCFFITLFLSNLILDSIFSRPNEKSEAAKALGDETKIIFFGSSRIENGIDPRYMKPTSVNIATPLANYDLLDRFAKHLLDKAPNLKLGVIEFDPLMFTDPREPYSVMEFMDYSIPFGRGLEFYLHQPLEFVRDQLYRLYQYRLTPEFMISYSHLTQREIIPGFVSRTNRINIPRMLEAQNYRKKAQHKDQDKINLEKNLPHLKNLIEMLRKKNAKYVFLKMPQFHLHHIYIPQILQETEKYILSQPEIGEHLIDLTRWNDHNADIFADIGHLNRDGAKLLSEHLSILLKDYL